MVSVPTMEIINCARELQPLVRVFISLDLRSVGEMIVTRARSDSWHHLVQTLECRADLGGCVASATGMTRGLHFSVGASKCAEKGRAGSEYAGKVISFSLGGVFLGENSRSACVCLVMRADERFRQAENRTAGTCARTSCRCLVM